MLASAVAPGLLGLPTGPPPRALVPAVNASSGAGPSLLRNSSALPVPPQFWPASAGGGATRPLPPTRPADRAGAWEQAKILEQKAAIGKSKLGFLERKGLQNPFGLSSHRQLQGRMREAKKLNPLPAPEPGTKVITEVSEAVRRPPAPLRVPSMPGPTASLTRAQGAPKLDEILRQRAQFQQEQVSGWHPVLQILWQLLGPPMWQNIVGTFKNTARAMNAYDDHGGLISSSIPREYDDGESGTNAWPVPAWWSRPPSWVDSAPRWWDDYTQKLASEGKIAGRPDADEFNAVN